MLCKIRIYSLANVDIIIASVVLDPCQCKVSQEGEKKGNNISCIFYYVQHHCIILFGAYVGVKSY